MSQRHGGEGDESVISWVLLLIGSVAIMATFVWLVTSNYIVYYLSPVFEFLATPYKWLPSSIAGTAVNDVAVQHHLNRWYPDDTNMLHWLGYINLTLRPAAVLFFVIVVFLTISVVRKGNGKDLRRIPSPPELARQLSLEFSETAPVIAIQEQLVKDKLPGWRKQTSPYDLLTKARYQKRSVLVEQVNDRGETVLMLDKKRLHGYFSQVKRYRHNGVALRESHWLGRQIVDLKQDSKNPSVVYMDRLSDVGKAIFSILAPHAFGAKAGRVASAEVKDALNYSAYGSPTGEANLALPIVQKTFNEWRNHDMVRKLARIHHWEYTFLASLLALAGRTGKIGTFQFIWLKPMNRCLFYVLNTVGRATPHPEATLAFSQQQYEEICARRGFLPLTKDTYEPIIFTEKTIESFEEMWEKWLDSEDDDDDWWTEGDNASPELLSQLSSLENVAYTPDMK